MTPTEIIAYIGAAAWLPHIISWIYKKVAISTIKIIPAGEIELGYSWYGPIFNLNLVLSTVKKDILIEKIEVLLKHEDGDQHRFSWQGLRETISELTNTSGERVVQEKDQLAIAVRLTTATLVEKFVRFQEERFKTGIKSLSENFLQHAKFLMNSGKDFKEALESKEFHELIEFYKTKFWWKSGKYFVEFKVMASKKFRQEQEKFIFELQSYDIDSLNKNIEAVKKTYELLSKGSGSFRITDSVLERLKEERVPQNFLKGIELLKEFEYTTAVELIETLKSTLPKDSTEGRMHGKLHSDLDYFSFFKNKSK